MQFERIAAALANAGERPARATKAVPTHRRRRCTRHAPAGHGCGWNPKRIAAFTRCAFQQQGSRASPFRGELKAAGGGHGNTLGFADNGAQPAVAKPIFHQGEQLEVVASLRVKHTARIEPGLIKSRRKQVASTNYP